LAYFVYHFAETGLFVGFFLPGDSLLFVSGIYSIDIIRETFGSTGRFFRYIYFSGFCSFAAIVGNEVGYYFGRKTGSALYKKEDTWFLKRNIFIRRTIF
jgi:membrane-associated protein